MLKRSANTFAHSLPFCRSDLQKSFHWGIFSTGLFPTRVWKRLFHQLLPLPHLSLPLPLLLLPTEPGLYLIYELADKHDYQNHQLTIYKGTLLAKMIA